MKIIFACRNNSSAIYLAQYLYKNNFLHGLLIESGKKAKQRKLNRLFKKNSIWAFPKIVLDIIALTFYSKIGEKKLQQFVQKETFPFEMPKNIPSCYVEDINDIESKNFLQKQEVDILVVLGTAILKPEIINIPKKHIFNIHGGIVPEYRNVHSDFWAYTQKDFEKIGVSIIQLDTTIDGGKVMTQQSIEYENKDSIFTIKQKNLQVAKNLILKTLETTLAQNNFTGIDQIEDKKGFYPTPTFFDLIKLAFK